MSGSVDSTCCIQKNIKNNFPSFSPLTQIIKNLSPFNMKNNIKKRNKPILKFQIHLLQQLPQMLILEQQCIKIGGMTQKGLEILL